MDKAALARRNFEEGYNCCQSVVLAFAPETGLSADTAALLAAGLGGGVSRLREVCGAVSGAAVVLGMLHGSVNPLDQEAKTALYAEVQELAVEFERRNGSYICRDLLGLPPRAGRPRSFGAHAPVLPEAALRRAYRQHGGPFGKASGGRKKSGFAGRKWLTEPGECVIL